MLSVDDMISEVFALTESVGVHDDTYYIYSSDHGYSLGELNLNWDKRNVCEETTSLSACVNLSVLKILACL